MEKMSGILPSNPRVTSVDLKDSPPARPGAPSHGKNEGRNSISDRVTLSARAKEMAAEQTLLGKKPEEASRIRAVNEINRKFFETRLKPASEVKPAAEKALESLESVEQFESSVDPLAADAVTLKSPAGSSLSIET